MMNKLVWSVVLHGSKNWILKTEKRCPPNKKNGWERWRMFWNGLLEKLKEGKFRKCGTKVDIGRLGSFMIARIKSQKLQLQTRIDTLWNQMIFSMLLPKRLKWLNDSTRQKACHVKPQLDKFFYLLITPNAWKHWNKTKNLKICSRKRALKTWLTYENK